MTTIQYEELDGFFMQMKELNKSQTVYMTTVRTKREIDMSGSIRVMFLDEHGVCHTYDHTEEIPLLKLINGSVFDLIPDPEESKKAKDDYMLTIKMFEDSLNNQFEKMKDILLTNMKMKKIIKGYATQ